MDPLDYELWKSAFRPFSASVVASVPEPETWWLVMPLACVIGLRRHVSRAGETSRPPIFAHFRININRGERKDLPASRVHRYGKVGIAAGELREPALVRTSESWRFHLS